MNSKTTIPKAVLAGLRTDTLIRPGFYPGTQIELPSNLALYQAILEHNGYKVLTPVDEMEQAKEMQKLRENYESRLRELEKLANIDSLTGLFRREYLLDMLEKKVISRNQYASIKHKRHNERHNDNEENALSFLICDLDHFKKVNDTYGHQAGDEVLRQFASILKSYLRESDVAGRYGGEEFGLIMPYANLEGSTSIAHRIREHVADTKFLEGKHQVTVSMGITQVILGDDSSMVINRADTALYNAKNSGRNQIQILMPDNSTYKATSLESMIAPKSVIVSSR